ncbi:hypothetical protein [Tepidibacter formicigenes]|jgi:hypothetical protein|uniref:Uncharacterized protein n=1 Tax=Tepidibacter formicigenes DSM 15518 TaxID=1123349 RepID=A0A1M6NEZ6_9FIRM|nr:hypothetical protein [Tepidibacter formicigenes]SHJ94219.1 hypothetical protein SAMN02744037_01249 [Tepidibacter formicigenes DSM 15518]
MIENSNIKRKRLIESLNSVDFKLVLIDNHPIIKIKEELVDKVYQDENDVRIKCFEFGEDFIKILRKEKFDNIFVQALFHTEPLVNFFENKYVDYEHINECYYEIKTNEKDIKDTFIHHFEVGGAMKTLETEEESIELSKRLYNVICENINSDLYLYFTPGVWNDYFFGIAWDRTYIIVNITTRKLWVMCFTDTD